MHDVPSVNFQPNCYECTLKSKVDLCYTNMVKMTGLTFIFISAQQQKNNNFTLTNTFPTVPQRFTLNLEEKEIEF